MPTARADLAPLLERTASLSRGHVQSLSDSGLLEVSQDNAASTRMCTVLHAGGAEARYEAGDAVLVWTGEEPGATGIVLGRIGAAAEAESRVIPFAVFAGRPETVVIEAQGDLVLRNGQARITLGAQGDIEIACASFSTRSRRLLRLLAPLIKLN